MPSHSLQSTRSEDRRSYSADSNYHFPARNNADAELETMDTMERRKLDTGLNREIEHKKALENSTNNNNDVPKRFHFFATPSNHDNDYGMDAANYPSTGLLETKKEIDELRNPPLSQERDWMLEGAQSIFQILQKKKSSLREPPPPLSSRTTHTSSEHRYEYNLPMSIPTRRRAQSVPKTRMDLDCDYNEYSSRLRDEMRKFQSSVRGSAMLSGCPSLDILDAHLVPIKVVETVDRGAQINTIDDTHNQHSKVSETVQLRTQLDGMMKDRLKDSQLRSKQWQAVGIESENLNLKQQLDAMQHAADDDAYKMTQMAEAYTVAMNEIEWNYERSLALVIEEGDDLRMKLCKCQEDNIRVLSAAMKNNELLRDELHTCQMENEVSAKATRQKNYFLQEELHKCRHRNEELKDEMLDVNTRCKAAEQDSESRRRIIINIECKYDD